MNKAEVHQVSEEAAGEIREKKTRKIAISTGNCLGGKYTKDGI